MKSKEALERIEQYIINEKGRLCFFIKLYCGTIKQDLERLEELEKENQALRNGIDLDLNAKLLSENKKLKMALDIIKKIVSIPLKDDFAKVKIDKETKEETHYYALSIKYLIDEQEYVLLKEVLGE